MAQSSYQSITLTSNITLSWPFSFQEGQVMYDINNVNASPGNFKITLPDATLATAGQNILFNNISANAFQIMKHDGTTSVTTVSAGEVYYLYLSDITTANGVWVPIPFGGGTSAINSVEAVTTGKTLVITNGTLTPPGGKITFETTASISNLLSDVTAAGFLTLKSTEPSKYATRSLIGGGNIVVTNPDGVSGDTIFSLATSLGDIASIEVGTLQLSGDVITTNVTNGGVQLSSAGTGKVSINGLQIDANGHLTLGTLKLSSNIITSTATNGAVELNSIGTGKVSINSVLVDTSSNITGVNNLTIGGSLSLAGSFTAGSFTSPTTPKVIFNFTDTAVPVGNTVVQLSQFNVASVTGSNGTYTITFTTPLASTNYAITFASGSNGGTPNAHHVFWTLKTTTTLTIAIVDASGVLVPNVPYGVSGAIYLPT